MLKGLSIRLDVVNLFDRIYLLRDGSGVGVGAPQYGAWRGNLRGHLEDVLTRAGSWREYRIPGRWPIFPLRRHHAHSASRPALGGIDRDVEGIQRRSMGK